MQSCYVLLSLCYRSLERQPTNHRSLAADKGLEELYAGVARVLAALQNYTIAFEALNGMAGKFCQPWTRFPKLTFPRTSGGGT